MIFSYFINPGMAVYDQKELPNYQEAAHWTGSQTPANEPRYNVRAQLRKRITLDDTDTYTLNYKWSQTSRTLLHYRVRGKCSLTLAGNDPDSGGISSVIPAEGNGIWTGMGVIVTSELTAAPIFTGLQDGTVFDIFAAECIDDDDPDIINNA